MRTYIRQWWQQRRARRISYEYACSRVQRGAAYLDDVDPGWYRRIDPHTLELSSGVSCVLGQLHGTFHTGLSRARLINLGSSPRASLSPISYGFQCVDGVSEAAQDRDYAHLNRAWREAVGSRHAMEARESLPGGDGRAGRPAVPPEASTAGAPQPA